MEYTRGTGVQGTELQLLIESTQDRMFGLPSIGGSMLSSADCLPAEARCSIDGSGGIPGFQAILIRAIQKSVAKIEGKIKMALYPRRKTNFAMSPEEVYKNRIKFGSGGLDSFLTESARTYPEWSVLSTEQQDYYNQDQNLYTPGSLPWELLTIEQQKEFSRQVLYVPNKSGDEERIDGKGRSLIQLYEKNVITIHKLSLEIKDPQGLGIPYLNRTYAPSEYFLYPKYGQVKLFPAQAKLAATTTFGSVSSSGYGLIVPSMPQILAVDYTYGFEKIPFQLQEAVALYAASKAFEMVNVAFTKGMLSYSVQGFSAAFGKGLYFEVMERYRQEAEDLLAPYYQIAMTAW